MNDAQQVRSWKPDYHSNRARKETIASLLFAGGIFLAGMVAGAGVLAVIINYTIL